MTTDKSSEREAFEAWAATVMLNLKRLYAGYFHEATAFAWLAWQARAALSQQAQETSLPPQGAAEWLQINTKRVAPWTDFAGKPIFAGDTIVHPSGETGVVVFLATESDPGDQWRVLYVGSATLSRLCLQIGDKGQAVVVDRAALAASPAPAPQEPADDGKAAWDHTTWAGEFQRLLDLHWEAATGSRERTRKAVIAHVNLLDNKASLGWKARALYASPAPGELGAVDASAGKRTPLTRHLPFFGDGE